MPVAVKVNAGLPATAEFCEIENKNRYGIPGGNRKGQRIREMPWGIGEYQDEFCVRRAGSHRARSEHGDGAVPAARTSAAGISAVNWVELIKVVGKLPRHSIARRSC